MWDCTKVLASKEGNVWKYIFEKKDAIAEAVLYKYADFTERTVICCSVQSGCPVGCTFCGTGKHFIRNLTSNEIVCEIKNVLENMQIQRTVLSAKRFQIMFMSMGEPMLNWQNVETAIKKLHENYPNAELLISTVGIDDDAVFSKIIAVSKEIDKVGLQFSIHRGNEEERNKLIPFKRKMNLRKLRDAGLMWNKETNRKVFLNYCVDENSDKKPELERIKDLFTPLSFAATFSVVCDANKNSEDKRSKYTLRIKEVVSNFLQEGYNTRMFNPAGQEDIGGGCGQLWYVQDWMQKYPGKT